MAKHPPEKQTFVLDNSLSWFEETWPIYRDKNLIEFPNDSLSRLNNLFVETFCYESLRKENIDSLFSFLIGINQTGISYFRLISNVGKEISFTIDGVKYQAEGKSSTDYTRFYYWFRHLCTAVILRDEAAIKLLCKVGVDSKFQKLISTCGFDSASIDFLAEALTGDGDIKRLVVEALKQSDPKFVEENYQDYVYFIVIPFIKLLAIAFLDVSEQEYKTAWNQAIKDHKHYWNSCARLRKEHDGWVSFPIMAASAFIFDKKGFKLPKESVYVPEWLVYGDFEPQPSVGDDFFEGEI
jgi:hypothetical protein